MRSSRARLVLVTAVLGVTAGLAPRARVRMEAAEPRAPTRNPLRLAVLRLGVTEPAWSSPLNREERDGRYACAGCGASLFPSTAKFDSGTGWPSFWRTSRDNALEYKKEWTGGTEVHCKSCGGHLGHVFADGPRTSDTASEGDVPTSDIKPSNGRRPRFCINGLALTFTETPSDSVGSDARPAASADE
mmetsp:Transcript_194/g.511  ORF Transcript_194/g.511 Transcript_194/m.511 type:complete len:188 (-) Transcript_194:195-758(-)